MRVTTLRVHATIATPVIRFINNELGRCNLVYEWNDDHCSMLVSGTASSVKRVQDFITGFRYATDQKV